MLNKFLKNGVKRLVGKWGLQMLRDFICLVMMFLVEEFKEVFSHLPYNIKELCYIEICLAF